MITRILWFRSSHKIRERPPRTCAAVTTNLGEKVLKLKVGEPREGHRGDVAVGLQTRQVRAVKGSMVRNRKGKRKQITGKEMGDATRTPPKKK